MLRQRDMHNSALSNQCLQKLPLKVGHQEDQAVSKQQIVEKEKST